MAFTLLRSGNVAKNMKWLWILIFTTVLLWSGIDPKDQFTWFLEVFPALIGVVILTMSYQKFRLTSLLYFLILLHSIVLMIGGHYTYAEVPLFDHLFGFERNNYDKVGHFFQGFVPALITREILIRHKVVNGDNWLKLFVLSVVLAFSALYELIEWWVSLATGEEAEAFLGTQGYIWDTQSDMSFAFIGAVIALITLSKTHDKQLQNKIES